MSVLSFYAGKKAYARIRETGLRPEDVKVMAGAAGGPKWLVLNQLDRALFPDWLHTREKPLFAIGSSIGAWRFAAVSQKDPINALDRFEKAYLEQKYKANPGPQDIDRELERILDRLLDGNGPEQILSHPFLRLNIMSVRCKGLTGSDNKWRLMPGLILAVIGNAFLRRSLGFFFERTLFYDPRDIPPFFNMKGFPINRIPLTAENIKPALMASGSIPMLMSGIKNIPDAPGGVYRDGGILDYHLNIRFMENDEGIVLYPHYAEKVVPGWLDKQIPWRKPVMQHLENVLLIAPSQSFLKRLPHQKIPDRTDFYTFAGKDEERIAFWRQVRDCGRRLADAFKEAVETGVIKERLKPMTALAKNRR